MAVSNHEASSISFLGLPGIFDVNAPKKGVSSNGIIPFSGVIAEAVQTVAITSRSSSDPLLAVGNRGHAGYVKKFGGVDVQIDAILTDNVNVSGAIGYQLSDFESILPRPSGLTLTTTNSIQGKQVYVSGLYVNSIHFTFNQNAASTTQWQFVADGITYANYAVANSGVVGNRDYHCVNPLTWDEIHILDTNNNVVLTGVQSANFTATLNRQEVMQIGQFEPYDRTVTHPYNVNVTLNTLANDVALTNWWAKFIPSYNPMDDCAGGLVIKVRTNSNANDATARDFIIASGLRPTTSTLNTAVGSNSTVALTFEGTFLSF